VVVNPRQVPKREAELAVVLPQGVFLDGGLANRTLGNRNPAA